MRRLAFAAAVAVAGCKSRHVVDVDVDLDVDPVGTKAKPLEGDVANPAPLPAGPLLVGEISVRDRIALPGGRRAADLVRKVTAALGAGRSAASLAPAALPFAPDEVEYDAKAEPRCCLELVTRGPVTSLTDLLREHDAALATAATAIKGWVVDGHDAAYTGEEWAEWLIVAEGDLLWRTEVELDGASWRTRGLARVGLPELTVLDTPTIDGEELLTALALALLHAPTIGPSSTVAIDLASQGRVWSMPAIRAGGGSGRATVHVARSPGGMLEVVFPGTREGLAERQAAIDGALFGDRAGEVLNFEETPEIRRLRARALEQVRMLAPRWVNGPPPGERLVVDAPFDAPLVIAYVEVEVTAVDGDRLIGTITSNPSAPLTGGLRRGSRVEVALEDVLDYQWTKSDGTTAGGEVNAALDE